MDKEKEEKRKGLWPWMQKSHTFVQTNIWMDIKQENANTP